MPPACIRQTDLPHTSRFFADFSYHFQRVAPFFRHDPHDPASYQEALAEVDYPRERREAMVAALRAQNGDSPALRKFAEPETVAVVTGQQVGLFSGPAYTIYKALTAARLAADLNERGIPAVPIFWLASEDHDFAEVDHVWSFDTAHQPFPLQVAPGGDSDRPVGSIELPSAPVNELSESLAGFPQAGEITALVSSAYPMGTTMAGGFRALLKALLGKLGLLYLDALDPSVRRIAAPLLKRAHEGAGELKSLLTARNRELEQAGYHAQVHIEPKTSLFFVLENGRRVKLRNNGIDPAALSPNALLRPVMQDYLLPTLAYVGGPAELAYLAQAQVLYDALLGRMPVMLARCGFTLLDARAAKLLERYRMSVPDVFTDEQSLRERIAQVLLPDSLHRTFEHTAAEVTREMDRLRTELEQFDHTLAGSLETSRRKILYQLDKIGRKAAREAMRRDERAVSDARFLSGLLYPNQHLQERLYSILPFLAKHGLDLVDRLYENVELACPDHRVLLV